MRSKKEYILILQTLVIFINSVGLIDLKYYLSLWIWFCARWKKVFAHNAYFILVLLNVFCILPIHFQNEKHHIFLFTWKEDILLDTLQSDKNKWFLRPSNIEFHQIDFSSSKQQIQFSGFLNGYSQLSNSGLSFQVIRFRRQTRMVGNNLLSKVFARLKIP